MQHRIRFGMNVVRVGVLAALAALGCGADEVTDGGGEGSEVPRTTVVTLHPDGTETVSIHDTEPAEPSGKVITNAISRQSPCPPYGTLELHDQSTLGGNQICFVGSGTVDLRRYCRSFVRVGGLPFPICRGRWDQNVRSYFSGKYAGYLSENPTSPTDSCQSFTPWLQTDAAGWCGTHAIWVTIN